MRIGLSIFPPQSGCSAWSNGAHQNCFFLAMTLREAGHDVVLVNGSLAPHPTQESMPWTLREFAFARAAEVVGDLDVLIQCGAQVSAEDVATVRARGGKAIAFKFGADYPIDAERMCHDDTESGAGIFNGAVFDEVWTTRQHVETSGAYWELTYRCPVRVLPHVWSPCFVDAATESCPRVGLPTGYQPGRARKRVVILEPNIQMIKTCHIPMLCAEAAWRKRPELIESVLVTNAIGGACGKHRDLRERVVFGAFARNLDICKARASDGQPVCSFEGRYNTPWIMAAHGDVVVSHQWISVPNYLLFDLMHLGYPIVHNVPELEQAGVGYFYEGFDANAGGEALIKAIEWHDRRGHPQEYDRAFLRTVDAVASANVEAHASALEDLCRV